MERRLNQIKVDGQFLEANVSRFKRNQFLQRRGPTIIQPPQINSNGFDQRVALYAEVTKEGKGVYGKGKSLMENEHFLKVPLHRPQVNQERRWKEVTNDKVNFVFDVDVKEVEENRRKMVGWICKPEEMAML
jgi:hypothetical protein